jgi:hypothetical protein
VALTFLFLGPKIYDSVSGLLFDLEGGKSQKSFHQPLEKSLETLLYRLVIHQPEVGPLNSRKHIHELQFST